MFNSGSVLFACSAAIVVTNLPAQPTLKSELLISKTLGKKLKRSDSEFSLGLNRNSSVESELGALGQFCFQSYLDAFPRAAAVLIAASAIITVFVAK